MFGLIKKESLNELQRLHENLLRSTVRKLEDGHYYVISMPAATGAELSRIGSDIICLLKEANFKNIAVEILGASANEKIEIKPVVPEVNIDELEPAKFPKGFRPPIPGRKIKRYAITPTYIDPKITGLKSIPKKKKIIKGGKKIGKKKNRKKNLKQRRKKIKR